MPNFLTKLHQLNADWGSAKDPAGELTALARYLAGGPQETNTRIGSSGFNTQPFDLDKRDFFGKN